MTRSEMTPKLKPSAEQNNKDPKKVAPAVAFGNTVSYISVPTQPRMMRKPRKLPINAPVTTAMCLFTALIQYTRKSATGSARIKPKRSATKIPWLSIICSADPPIRVMPPKICCDVLSSDPIIRHLGGLWQYQAFDYRFHHISGARVLCRVGAGV